MSLSGHRSLGDEGSGLTEIRVSSQRGKDVTHIIRGRNALLKRRAPTIQDPSDHFDAREIDVLDRRREPSLVDVQEILQLRDPWRRAVEVTRRAHDDGARDVGQVELRGSENRLECRVVFLCRRAVHTRPIGPERRGVFKGFREPRARVVDVGCGDVASKHARWLGSSLVAWGYFVQSSV